MRGRRNIAGRTADLDEPRTCLSRGQAAPHSKAPGWTGAESGGVRLRGVHDLNRLLWEWTADYAAMFPNADSRVPGGVASLALCGGSALAFADKNQYALMMRVAALSALKPVDSAPRVGFRCVRDFPGE